jgi:recombination protein RecA
LKFYSSVRIEVRRGEAIKNGSELIGNKTKCKIVKNKVAPPFKEVVFDIIYGEGVSRVGEIIDFAVDADIIEKSGAWFSYNGERIGQGRDKVKQFLKDNPELCEEIAEKVKAHSAELLMKEKAKASPAGAAASAGAPPAAPVAPDAGIDIDIEADESDFE